MRRSRPPYLVFDIETVPDLARWQRPQQEGSDAAPTAPTNGDKPGFPPLWAHQIITIGTMVLDHGYQLARFEVIAGSDEPTLLANLCELIDELRPTLVSYNGRAFDLPVIAMRSLCHGIPMAWYYRDRETRVRHSEHGHLDLCDWLADHGAVRAGKLDAIARLIGLPGKLGIDGSQVEGLFREGKLAAIERYCLGDVAQTALLLLRFRLLQGRLAPAIYDARAIALREALARVAD